MKTLLILLSLLVVSFEVHAQNWVRTNGPVEDIVRDVCIDSNGILYAGTAVGVNRSTNGGDHWTRPFVFPTSNGQPRILIARDGSIIAASFSGIFRSVDSANTFKRWVEDSPFAPGNVSQFAMTGSGRIFASRLLQLLYSDDNGQTWIEALNRAQIRGGMKAVAASHDTVIAHSDSSAYVSYDNGQTWKAFEPTPGSAFIKLLILPNGTWVSLDWSTGLWRYAPGEGWTPIVDKWSCSAIFMCDWLHDGSLIVSTKDGIFIVRNFSVWFDITNGFERIGPFTYYAATRFIEDTIRKVVYVATFDAGVWKRMIPQVVEIEPALPSLRVVPNPLIDRTTIHLSEIDGAIVDIELRNILGAVVWKKREYNGGEITISPQLPPGNYLLVLRTGERTETQWVTIVK